MSSAEAIPAPEEGFVDELKPGTRLMHGQYTIRRYLNSGGFGITYLASDSLDRAVVIKECFPGAFCHRSNMLVQARSRAYQAELRTIVRLFTQEARALAKLKHPNIVGVHHVFEENNTAYMALDYLNGKDLLSFIGTDRPRLAPATVRTLLEKLLDATGCVHEAGLLHRDISPDNIIVTDTQEPILIDFGAAREQATRTTRALSALRVVKDGYSPQEFYIAGRQQGPSSDLYSLAASFYHLITGDVPPDSQLRISAQVAGEPDPYVPLGRRTKDYDPVFCAALDRAMAILPNDRMQSAREWLDLMSGRKPIAPAVAPTPSPAVRLAQARTAAMAAPALKPRRARGAFGAMLLGSALALLAVAGFLVVMGPPERPQAAQTAAAVPGSGADATTAAAQPPVAAQEPAPVPAPAALDVAAAATPAAPAPAAPPALMPDLAGPLSGSWTVELPFVTAASDPLLIETAAPGAPAGIAPGNRILAVNGRPVAGASDLAASLREGRLSPDGGTVEVGFLVADRASGTEVPQSLQLPVVHETAFANGLRLRSSVEGGAWVTRVASVPPGQTGSLREGDILVALIPSQEAFAAVLTLRALFAREIGAGRNLLRVAVRRNDSIWVETLLVGQGAS